MANPALTSCLLFTVIHQILAVTVDIPQPVYEVARGDNAIIPCTFVTAKPNPVSIFITWVAKSTTNPDDEADIVTYFHYANNPDTIDISEAYKNRVAFTQDISKGQTSLTLNSVTSKDNTTMECKVQIPGDSTGKTFDTAKLVVLVAPSKPNCNIQGKTDFYSNVTMTCLSDEGIPTPTYKWQKYDASNTSVPLPIKSTDVNGLLSLYNLSADHNGYYVCTATNKMRSATCNVTLAVTYSSMNIASTAGIIGGCVAGLILFIVVICCCCRRCRQDEKEEYDMGSINGGKFPNTDQDEIKEEEGRRIEVQPDLYENEEPGGDRQRDNDRQGRLAPPDRDYDRQSDRYSDRYDDRQSDRYDDRRSDRYDDRRSDRYDDRRSDRYDDRRSDRNDDNRSDRYDDRRRDRNDDSRDRYDDRRRDDRYDDRRRDEYDDRRGRYDQPDDGYDRSRPPSVPVNKPPRG